MGDNQATRRTASTFGILVGVAGIEHGLFEVLQGNLRPGGFLIAAIGPGQRFWEHGTETALTIVPSFLVSGVLAMIMGVLMILWSARFVDKRYGAVVLFLLGVISFLVGGGFAPIFLTVLAGATATGINRPLRLWRRILPAHVRGPLAWLWTGSLVALISVYAAAVEIAVLGYPVRWIFDAETTLAIQYACAYLMVGLMVLSVLTAIAFDVERRGEAEQT
jgi:Zn-dependent protease with chaperone function